MVSVTTIRVINRMFKRPIDLSRISFYIKEIDVRLKYEKDGFAAEYIGFNAATTITIEDLEESIKDLKYIKDQEYMKYFMC